MNKDLLVLLTLSLASCQNIASLENSRVVECVGRDGSVIQSSVQSNWWLEQRSGSYQSGAQNVFVPRPGDECVVREVPSQPENKP